MLQKQFIWKGNETIENFQIEKHRDGYKAKSIVNGILKEAPLLIAYEVEISKNWEVEKVQITSLLNDKENIVLQSDKNGRWIDQSAQHKIEFDGCIDIDISVTPFTNTLPIKRLGDRLEKRTRLEVLYFNLSEWKIRKVEQYYTKINQNLFRYEGVFRNFEADLPVDDNQFVLSYPSLFERLYPKG